MNNQEKDSYLKRCFADPVLKDREHVDLPEMCLDDIENIQALQMFRAWRGMPPQIMAADLARRLVGRKIISAEWVNDLDMERNPSGNIGYFRIWIEK